MKNSSLYVGKPNVGNEELFHEFVREIFASKRLTNDGPFVQRLERKIEEYLGVSHCILTCNGTIALQIAIKALKLSGEVIVPAFTFPATVHALAWEGVKPVFADVNSATHCLDLESVRAAIAPQTSGILGVHLWGNGCRPGALEHVAMKHGLKLFFDAAHAFGCSYNGNMIGTFGELEVFSFHATKFFNTLEGGAIVTNNSKLAEEIRSMRNFGFVDYDRIVSLGINGKMNEICAAMGLVNMECVEDVIAVNKRNYEQYREELQGFEIMVYNENERNNYQYIVIEVDRRDEVQRALWKEGIYARSYFAPGCHRIGIYNEGLRLPVTDRLVRRALVLPTGSAVGKKDIGRVCGIIRGTLHKEGRKKMETRQKEIEELLTYLNQEAIEVSKIPHCDESYMRRYGRWMEAIQSLIEENERLRQRRGEEELQ